MEISRTVSLLFVTLHYVSVRSKESASSGTPYSAGRGVNLARRALATTGVFPRNRAPRSARHAGQEPAVSGAVLDDGEGGQPRPVHPVGQGSHDAGAGRGLGQPRPRDVADRAGGDDVVPLIDRVSAHLHPDRTLNASVLQSGRLSWDQRRTRCPARLPRPARFAGSAFLADRFSTCICVMTTGSGIARPNRDGDSRDTGAPGDGAGGPSTGDGRGRGTGEKRGWREARCAERSAACGHPHGLTGYVANFPVRRAGWSA